MWCHHILLSDIILNKSHVDLDFGLSFNLWFNNISICTSYMKFEVSLSKIFFKKQTFYLVLDFLYSLSATDIKLNKVVKLKAD